MMCITMKRNMFSVIRKLRDAIIVLSMMCLLNLIFHYVII